jgi:hypothetical protein
VRLLKETKTKPMRSEIEAHLPPLAPSTSMDGLDLTVGQARAMSPELFRRTFSCACLDDVPTVGPGFLPRRPPHSPWYVRFRPRPADPGPKDRKTDIWELVVPQGGGAAPAITTLKAKDAAGAGLEALIVIARAQGKTIRASTWPVERIEGLRCFDLLREYLAVDLAKPKNRKETKKQRKNRNTYSAALRAFQRAFPTLEIGDCKGRIGDLRGRIDQLFEERTGHAPTSRYASLRTVAMALNAILGRMGAAYQVEFVNPDPGPLLKPAWTPDQYDRLRAGAQGWRHHPGGAPMMIVGPHGPVQARRRSIMNRMAWSRMIPTLAYSVSRNGQIHLARWVPGWVEPAGRGFEPGEERPWFEVLPDCIVFHRDGEQRYDGSKKHGWNFVPKEFEPEMRAWYAADMAAGIEWVFHKPDGERYGENLPHYTFNNIVADGGLPEGTHPHELKDLAVQWARAARVPDATFAKHADTSQRTLERTYGPSRNVDELESAAELITQTVWRENEGRRAAQAESFAQSRDEARASAAAAKEAARKAADRERATAKKAAEHATRAARTPAKTPGALQVTTSNAMLRLVPATPTAPQSPAPARRRQAGAASSD